MVLGYKTLKRLKHWTTFPMKKEAILSWFGCCCWFFFSFLTILYFDECENFRWIWTEIQHSHKTRSYLFLYTKFCHLFLAPTVGCCRCQNNLRVYNLHIHTHIHMHTPQTDGEREFSIFSIWNIYIYIFILKKLLWFIKSFGL